MALQYLHGIETLEVDDGIRPIQTVRSAVIGIVGTAPDADPDLFPINEPVLIAGNPRDVALLGLDGTLPDALANMFKVVRPTIIVVRVEEGLTPAETLGNVLGSPIMFTGLHALRKARSKFGFGPRLVVTPGFTTQRPTDGLASVTVTTGGTLYSADTTITVGGPGAGARVRPVINSGGQLVSVVVEQPGIGYTSAPTLTVVDPQGLGSGAALVAVPGAVANPIAAEMSGLLRQLRAYGFVNSGSTSYADAISYRSGISSDRMMILDGNARVTVSLSGETVTMPSAPFAAAMQAWVDDNYGFWHSFSNRPVPGIVGVDRPIEWAFTDSNVEGQLLNSNQITVLVNDEGFRFMGVRSAISTGQWQFMPVRRTTDMVYESVENALREAVDKPISVALLDWVEGSVNSYLRILTRRGALIGGRCWLDRAFNSPAELMAGHVTFDYDLEPPAPLERLTFRTHRNPEYYTELVESYLRTA